LPEGLYRTTMFVPNEHPAAPLPSGASELSPGEGRLPELISADVVGLRFSYFSGAEWLGAWETTDRDRRLPLAVSIELALRDARGSDHVYQTIVPIPTR